MPYRVLKFWVWPAFIDSIRSFADDPAGERKGSSTTDVGKTRARYDAAAG
jgi:hypothetical protein